MKKLALTAGLGLVLSLLVSEQVKAADFTFNPTVTFEVIDADFPPNSFDGLGDELFPNNFDTVVLGSIGEAAEFAEFNISSFSIPPSQSITNAIFQVQVFTTQTFGLGSPGGVPPNRLGVFGYVGNGQPDASDLQASTLLNTVNTSTLTGGEILNFNVTSFVQNLVSNGDTFVGLAVRALDPGGLTLGGANFPGSPPRLIITTTPVTTTVPESSHVLSLLAFSALGIGAMLKQKI